MPQEQFNTGGYVVHMLYLFLPLIAGWIHVSVVKLKRSEKIELFLIYYLVIAVGVQALFGGYLQIFHSEYVSQYVGWKNTPFLRELGMANITFGVLAISSIWIRGHWRTAAGVAYGLFLWLAAIGHIFSYFETEVTGPGNIGPTLWTDILIPVALFILLGMRKKV